MNDLENRLRTRAYIRRQIPGRKSAQEGKPDRIADLLDEAAMAVGLCSYYRAQAIATTETITQIGVIAFFWGIVFGASIELMTQGWK